MDSITQPIFLALLATVVGLLILFSRYRVVANVVNSGEPQTATITTVNFFRDRGRVEYDYRIGEQNYHKGTAIMKNKLTKNYAEGQPLDIIVSSENPESTIITELYVA